MMQSQISRLSQLYKSFSIHVVRHGNHIACNSAAMCGLHLLQDAVGRAVSTLCFLADALA